MTDNIRVVVVDDVAETRDHLANLLSFENDIQVLGSASSGEEALPLSQKLRPDVPRGVADVIGRALRKEPAERFESARAMAQALAAVLRRIPKPTGSDELGRSVAETRARLGSLRCDGESTVELAASDLVEVPGKDVG